MTFNEKTSDPLISDLRRRYEGYSTLPFSEETDKQGFDKLYTRSEQYKLEVLASKSNAVVWLCYYGDKDMQTVIDAVMRTVAGG
jgi:G:T/U-mismatch repair DNA glycosylase